MTLNQFVVKTLVDLNKKILTVWQMNKHVKTHGNDSVGFVSVVNNKQSIHGHISKKIGTTYIQGGSQVTLPLQTWESLFKNIKYKNWKII